MARNLFSAGRTTDMTTGSPVKLLLQFAVPLLIGNLFQQIYNMVDSIVVGRFVGTTALAAVGACGSLNFLGFSLVGGLSIGISVLISQQFGAGQTAGIRRVIGNSVWLLAAASVLVGSAGIFLAEPLLHLLGTPDTILPHAVVYLRTSCAGVVAVAAYNGISSIMRALGDSKTPLYFLITSCLLNVVLDVLLVTVFGLGVLGVALATIASQAVSAVGCLFYAVRHIDFFTLAPADWRPSGKIIRESLRLGIPIAVQNALIAISCVVLQSVVNGFGESVIAAYTITGRVEQLVGMPYSSLATAVTTYTGQNIGAGKLDRVHSGYRSAVRMTLIFSLCMLPLAYLFGADIIRIFVADAEVVRIGSQALRITSICYFPLGLIYIPRALMNGAGDARFSMINGMTEVCCRILFSNVLTRIPQLGFWGIWVTTGATWMTTAGVCLLRYHSGVWQNKAVAATLGDSERK